MEGIKGERDTRFSVVSFWKGFEKTGPRLWDEDSWPVRYPYNTVQRAFRTVVFQRGPQLYLLVVDDTQKDRTERLYEWLMQTGPNTELLAQKGNDYILGDATMKRDANGQPQPQKGDRLLLVRVLQANDPKRLLDYPTRPSVRLETFERRDTLMPESTNLSGSRSFGLDKRLVIPSRSVAPNFRILLYPHRQGNPLPETGWNEAHTRLKITVGPRTDNWSMDSDPQVRTLVRLIP